MFYRDDWDELKLRYERFWSGERNDDCLISAYAPKKENYGVPPEKDEQDSYVRRMDPEVILRNTLTFLDNACLAGDAFAMANMYLGASGHAGFFRGVNVKFTNSVWFLPSITDDNLECPVFDEDAFLYKKTMEITEYLTRESRGRYMVSVPDISGNADALAHLRGSQNLMIDFIDEPDWIKASLEKIQAGWKTAMDRIFSMTTGCNDGGNTIGWLHTYAPGRHAQLQCDLSVMLSCDLFREFILPDLCAQAAELDCPLYHLDGVEQIRHLDMILSIPGLKAIQWTPVAGQPSPVQFIPELQKIQNHGVRLLLNELSVQEAMTLVDALDMSMVHFVLYLKSPEEAEGAVRMIRKACWEKARKYH